MFSPGMWWKGVSLSRSGCSAQIWQMRSNGVSPRRLFRRSEVVRGKKRGEDVIVVASLNEFTFFGYPIGFPRDGVWHEVFNSDVYDNWVNPIVAGNGGQVIANGQALQGFVTPALLVIPANGLLVFTQAS